MRDSSSTNLSFSSNEDINGRYFEQDNSGTFFPGDNKNGAYNPNGGGSFGGNGNSNIVNGNNGNRYPVNGNNDYNPNAGNSGSFSAPHNIWPNSGHTNPSGV